MNIKLYISCALLTVLIFSVDLSIPLGVAGGVPYIAVVLISLRSTRIMFTIYIAIITSLLIITGFYLSPSGGELWKVLSNRGLALFAIWVTAAITLQKKRADIERELALDEREKAITDLRILRGFLPICSSCKKIRDDSGYWNQLEGYISSHSEAEFSHSLCEDCSEKLYGDQKWYKKLKDKV